jgi:putative nucleotidyltransferase with HDIG domain
MTTTSKPSTPAASDLPDDQLALDPVALFRGFVSLRRLTGMYPPGHPSIVQKLAEIDDAVQGHLRRTPFLHLDIIHGDVHLDGVSYRQDGETQATILRELTDVGIDSIHVRRGVTREELQSLSEFLWQLREVSSVEPMEVRLAKRNIHHVSLGRLVPLDTRWKTQDWPDAPTGPLDPSYAESLALMERTFDDVAHGKGVNLMTVREIVELLIRKVAGSSAALAQILAVKLYENLTYCHSVNVATLGLLIGRQLGFDPATTAALAEAALLHDIGKTRIPIELLRKPGALDKRERRMMESHTVFGAEILVDVEGLKPLTPTVALEHHRGVDGGGYPDLGAAAVPHLMSQVVAVADIYEAMTGARSYQEPATPEKACLVLARLAGTKLNTALVKAFVNAITFFPLGSVVRTSRDEIGIVIRTNPSEPLHPVIALLDGGYRVPGEIDTSRRTLSGSYERHVVETLRPRGDLNIHDLLQSA